MIGLGRSAVGGSVSPGTCGGTGGLRAGRRRQAARPTRAAPPARDAASATPAPPPPTTTPPGAFSRWQGKAPGGALRPRDQDSVCETLSAGTALPPGDAGPGGSAGAPAPTRASSSAG